MKPWHKQHSEVDAPLGTFSPRQECVDFRLPRVAGELAVSRKLLAPIICRRQFPHGCLALPDHGGRRWREKPDRKFDAATWWRGRAEPLKERRAPGGVEIEGVRMVGKG